MIDGVKVIPLRRIPDERGMIAHMLRADEPHFIAPGALPIIITTEHVILP